MKNIGSGSQSSQELAAINDLFDWDKWFRMASDGSTLAHDASVEAALEAVGSFDGPVLIDLDETLYLRNSTEDFIDCACPALAAYTLLKLLDVARPWRWTGPDTRDVWRVRLVLTLFPWTRAIWRRRVGALVESFGNASLQRAMAARSDRPIIATLGFVPVVRPLIAALGFPSSPVIAARVWTAADRRDGKLALVIRALGHEATGRSLCLTDSLQDLPLLDSCSLPLRTIWPQARFRAAFSGLYLPGRYLSLVKRPGTQYVRRSILQDDFALWVLTSVWLASFPLLHVLGLAALLVSFWAVYEKGYVDNDLVAARFETDPRLTPEFGQVEIAVPVLTPWLWALVAGTIGITLFRWPDPPSPGDAVIWVSVLAVTGMWFRFFNRLDKATRIWPYGLLQLARCAAFATLVPLAPMAPAAIGASTMEKWVPYIVYRKSGVDGWSLPLPLLRLGFFLVLLLAVAPSVGAGMLIEAPTLAFLAYLLFRARRDIRSLVDEASWITRADRHCQTGLASDGAEMRRSA